MADSYTMTATINEPVQLVVDMSLSLERVIALLENTNSEYMEQVVECVSKHSRTVHRLASNIFCINQIAIEKLTEIQLLLADAETSLNDLQAKREG